MADDRDRDAGAATAASPPISPSRKGRRKRRDRRHPGDFRGQRGHPPQMRPSGPSLGYLAVAPDLFWRLEPGVELDPDVPDAVPAGARPDAAFDQDQGIADIEATIRDARAAAARGRQGRLRRLLPGRPARLHDRGAHRHRRQRRLLRRRPRGAARREARHRPPADAAHRRRRPFRHARQAGADPRGARRPSQGDDPRLSRRGSRLRRRDGQRRSEEAARLADSRTEAFFAEHVG